MDSRGEERSEEGNEDISREIVCGTVLHGRYVPVTRCRICGRRLRQALLELCNSNSPLVHHVMSCMYMITYSSTVQYRVQLEERMSGV